MKQSLPDIHTDLSEWYHAVVEQAELADQAPVRGCMVIRPYGFAIWELIQQNLDQRIKAQGYVNAAFPLLIPESFLKKEKEHVEGFAPEVAVVTHAGGKELEEPLIVRPTSETIIHSMFSRWIHSWRDLPLKVNQWCSVVRWEMRPRAFLRTTEFWWHECHAAHATYDEAYADMQKAHYGVYKDFIEKDLAIPVFSGDKPAHERFAGGLITMTHEGIMPDGKALQMATTHLLAQSFSEAFNIQFQDQDKNVALPYLSSWGATTRLIGGLILSHGDAKGLILPPAIAPYQIVIVPIVRKQNTEVVLAYAEKLKIELQKNYRVLCDNDITTSPGQKFYTWELKGVPLRIEVGGIEMEQQTACLVHRTGGTKHTLSTTDTHMFIEEIGRHLQNIQQELYQRAHERIQKTVIPVTSWENLLEATQNNLACQGFWCEQDDCRLKLKAEGLTIRCIREEDTTKEHACCACGKKAHRTYLIAKAY